ncbi:MAG: hypothetical protein ABL867_08090, partial [Rickettsiales bacterium]
AIQKPKHVENTGLLHYVRNDKNWGFLLSNDYIWSYACFAAKNRSFGLDFHSNPVFQKLWIATHFYQNARNDGLSRFPAFFL